MFMEERAWNIPPSGPVRARQDVNVLRASAKGLGFRGLGFRV